MKGVKEVGMVAFARCDALEYVECYKLEITGQDAFRWCDSMTSFNLPSAKTISTSAFQGCKRLKYVKFGKKLEAIGPKAFYNCHSLQRITIPLKNGLFDHDDVFRQCWKLKHVDLVDREVLQETADALLREEWKNDLNAKIESIDQVLPNTTAGNVIDDGKKAIVLRRWISEVLDKIIYYKSQHRRLLKEAESRLQLALPHDIVMNNVVPFLTLPQHTFDGEEEIVESNDDNKSIDERYSFALGSDEEKEEEDNDGVQEGAADAGEERKQDGANYEERRKRQRTESNGTM